jgi:CHAD domain-containing protein
MDLLDIIFETKRITPGTYSSKMNFQLDPMLPVTQTADLIHGYLLTIMQQNVDGIIKDIDTEFLHDFRVAVRRIRSLYSHLKKELAQQRVAKAQSDFARLGKFTNRMRDIDVYLLNKETYFGYLPAEMAQSIVPFYKMLADERKLEHKKLTGFLLSRSYLDVIKTWQRLLAQTDSDQTGDPPILKIARKYIITYFNKVMKMGRAITPNSPDSVLHKLRIECKKLRYILEFYASLFPPDLIPALIRQLKILQDNLGEFNDYSVQQINLQEYIAGLPLNSQKNKKIITAVGFLIGKLNERQLEVRKDFAKTFKQFSGPETLKIFEQIKMVQYNENNSNI